MTPRPFTQTFARRIVAAFLAASVALALVFGGRAFLWCPWMQRAISQDCCHQSVFALSAPQQDDERPALERSNCCEKKVLPTAPPASAERVSLPELSAHLAVLPAASPIVSVAPVALTSVFVSARERGARAGPHPPLYELHCAYLI